MKKTESLLHSAAYMNLRDINNVQKKPDTKEYFIHVHFAVQRKAKLILGDRNQNSGYLWEQKTDWEA